MFTRQDSRLLVLPLDLLLVVDSFLFFSFLPRLLLLYTPSQSLVQPDLPVKREIFLNTAVVDHVGILSQIS